MRKVLIIGAGSAIAEAVARILAARGDALYLVARRPERLEVLADDLKVRGAKAVHSEVLDVNNFDGHKAMIDRADTALQQMDTIFIAHGTLSDQKACQASADLALAEIKTNALSMISLLTPVSTLFEERKNGTIVVISHDLTTPRLIMHSLPNSRHLFDGCAKAMVTAFLSGLRQRLGKSGVRVITVKPGFVDTPMTKDFKKGFLWASPEKVAADIVKVMDSGTGELYTPWFWRLIMLAIQNIPEVIFSKLRI